MLNSFKKRALKQKYIKNNLIKKIFLIVLAVSLLIMLFFYCALFSKNKEELKTVTATVVSIENVDFISGTRGPDTLQVSMVISYEKDGEIIEVLFEDSTTDIDIKEMMVTLEEGDKISLYKTVFGLSFDKGNETIVIGLTTSTLFFICILVLLF